MDEGVGKTRHQNLENKGRYSQQPSMLSSLRRFSTLKPRFLDFFERLSILFATILQTERHGVEAGADVVQAYGQMLSLSPRTNSAEHLCALRNKKMGEIVNLLKKLKEDDELDTLTPFIQYNHFFDVCRKSRPIPLKEAIEFTVASELYDKRMFTQLVGLCKASGRLEDAFKLVRLLKNMFWCKRSRLIAAN
eukprot:1185829-Prorocentrum_minimum.AAC.3